MPKVSNPFVFQQPGFGTDNYIEGGPTRAGLEELRAKANLAPYVFSTVSAAQAETYSEPESCVVVETGLLYFYDSSSSETVDGFSVLSTGGAGRLLARKKSYGCVQVALAGSTGTITAGTPVNVFGNSVLADSAIGSVDFTVDNTNKRLIYSGTLTKKVHVEVSLSILSSVKDIVVKIYVYKNGSLLDPYGSSSSLTVVGDIACITVCDQAQIQSGDYFEVFADIDTGTTTLTPNNGVLSITEI